ncbi:glycerol-3-phosphate dehydrogenase subunit GlpB [Micropruina sp.]|uniref:glycerol-3-phosphate dehydrogenase subunit GlpB n=1 Tax=Micropruina sp. TaxID=2737536 RepID=UPI0039E29BA7
MTRVVVIGAGVSGLVAAIRLARAGAAVTLLAKGTGGLQLSQGTIDILGYAPDRVERPLDALGDFAKANPEHPYAFLDAELVGASASYVAELVGPELLVGDPAVNLQLPTAVGAVRPTALASPSMTAGACVDGAKFVIIGLKQLKDFYPELVAYNLNRTDLPGGGRLEARPVMLGFPAREGEVDSSGLTYARALDDPATRKRFAEAVKPLVAEGESVGLPAVLGLDDHNAWSDIADLIGAPVFEIPLPPPSVPGMRLNRTLTAVAKASGVRVVPGSKVTGYRSAGGSVACVQLATAGGIREFAADAFLLSTGGFESGALHADSHHNLRESIFDLPLRRPEGALVHGDYWGDPQPLFMVGVETGPDLLVRHPGGDAVYDNLYAAGGILAGATRWQEKSGEGIALASAVKAADSILAANQAVSTQGAAS